ncbi:MAG: methyltransferase domain-containing protein, partial [Polyangiaceae bacterium]
ERALDPDTIALLERVGVRPGMRCLEVGPGLGSIARWMAERVGPTGRVLGLDINARFAQQIVGDRSNITFRVGDIATEAGEADEFDIVHARLVIGHVRDKDAALRNILRCTRSAGQVLIEDVDFLWTDVGTQPVYPERHQAVYSEVWASAVRYMEQNGFEVHFGRRLAGLLRTTGFERVGGRVTMHVGDPDVTRAMRFTVARFGPALLNSGSVSAAALRAFDDLMASPDIIFTGSPTFSIWATKPTLSATNSPLGRA